MDQVTLSKMQVWYSNPDNRKRQIERVTGYLTKQREFVREWKTAGPCTDCGIDFPYWIMQADHIRGDKLFNLNSVSRTTRNKTSIQAELDKCERVCANCHADRTFHRQETRLAAR